MAISSVSPTRLDRKKRAAEGLAKLATRSEACNWSELKKTINVVGAVLTRDQTVLAARRSTEMSLPGMWEFPGGKIEPNESPEQALRRELEEELLCPADIGSLIETTEHEYDFGIVVLTTYYCSLAGTEPRLTEHSEIRWVPVNELDRLDWAPADLPAVTRVMSDLRK